MNFVPLFKKPLNKRNERLKKKTLKPKAPPPQKIPQPPNPIKKSPMDHIAPSNYNHNKIRFMESYTNMWRL